MTFMHFKVPSIILLVVMSLTVIACDSSDQIRPDKTLSISGKITGNGINVSNIVLSDGKQQVMTDADGNYQFTALSSGIYTITPIRNDLEFTPDSIAITLTSRDVANQNFSAYKRGSNLFSISGRIIGNGIDVSNIIVSDGIHFDTTDGSGYYSFSGLPKGTHTITPKRGDLKITPDSISASIVDRDLPDRDFIVRSNIEMVNINGGTFVMGCDSRADNEKPAHSVTVSSFQMGKYELTQLQWYRIMRTQPSAYHNDNNPVETVSWVDAVQFCNKLSAMQGLQQAYTINGNVAICDFNANGYRLPTEAEWEYACRAGTTTDRYSGNISKATATFFKEPNLDTIAWYRDHDPNTPSDSAHPVGLKAPNPFGLYDMMGNVTEWCWDYWMAGDNSPYSASAQNNPTGPATGDTHALRGGSWYDKPLEVRSSFHRNYSPINSYSGVGFRIVRRP